MKIWKIKNIFKEPITFSYMTSSSSSQGMMLQPEDICLVMAQLTAPLDAQRRRGFITIEQDYDNALNLPLGTPLKESDFVVNETIPTEEAPISKMEEAEKDAIEYIKKS